MKRLLLIIGALIILTMSTAFAADEQVISGISMGTSRSEIHEILGKADISSANGLKDVYRLSDGKKAVFQYYADILEHGYILIAE